MKKMKFILPAIFGMAIITGLAAILLAAISKILIVTGIVGTAIYFGVRRMARRHQQQQYAMYGAQGFHQMNDGNGVYPARQSFYRQEIVPVDKKQRHGIIPIN